LHPRLALALAALLAAISGLPSAVTADSGIWVDFHRTNFIVSRYDENGRNGAFDDAKFQFSIRTKLLEFDLNSLQLAYTQRSRWDVAEESAPFETTDFNPELFLEFAAIVPAITFVRLGIEHESNGVVEDLDSRSWERAYASMRLGVGTCSGMHYTGDPLSGWGAFLEGKGWVFQANLDEKNLFHTYAGYYEVRADIRYRAPIWGEGVFEEFLRSAGLEFRMRGLPIEEGDRGLVEVVARLALTRTMQLYVQYFRGYGELLAYLDAEGWREQVIRFGLRFGS